MNIKSLLLGSAAALAVVSGAHAADAIVAAEPEPAEFVKVCDAFGAGYFYIPGTETCLSIRGHIRIQQDVAKSMKYNPATTGEVDLTAMSDSELGKLGGFAEIDLAGGGAATVSDIWISLGGFKAGRYGGLWDKHVAEFTDFGSNPGAFKAQYTGSADAASFGLEVDEIAAGEVGVVAQAGTSLGGVSLSAIVAYDAQSADQAASVKLFADVGSAHFGAGWFGDANVGGANAYNGTGHDWVVAAAYDIKASDALTITPEVEYFAKTGGGNGWKVGELATYTIVPGLDAQLGLTYNDTSDLGGRIRLQRNF